MSRVIFGDRAALDQALMERGQKYRYEILEGLVLIRAIREDELAQLSDAGQDSFRFTPDTCYDTLLTSYVKYPAEQRTGVIVLHTVSAEDIREKRFHGNIHYGFPRCVREFYGNVEVFRY